MSGERIRAETRRLLAAGVSGRVFPGAVAAIAVGDSLIIEAADGTLTGGPNAVTPATRYDLGGITQSFVALACLRLAEHGRLDLDMHVEQVLPDVRGGRLRDVPLRALLEHRAGVATWGGLYLDVPHDVGTPAARRWIVGEAARRIGEEGERYSELGYAILGEALARALGRPLDEIVAEEVIAPLGLERDILYPGALPSEQRPAFALESAPTERCEWRGELVHGQVQDENAAALGGVAGHAGLFGRAAALARFGRALLQVLRGESGGIVHARTLKTALAGPADDPWRAGFRVNAGDRNFGRRLGSGAFGMTGFPGTSFFCDPDSGSVIVLLSNRIFPSRANEKIQGFLPAFHDSVLAALAG